PPTKTSTFTCCTVSCAWTRPHPHSTLFPYTTLFRSDEHLRHPGGVRRHPQRGGDGHRPGAGGSGAGRPDGDLHPAQGGPLCGQGDRKSTRLNSSHVSISYAVFCLKKKKIQKKRVRHE